MKKTLLLTIICFSVFTAAVAQSKMNFSFARNIQEQETDPDKQVGMLIQGNVSQIEALVKGAGGTFQYAAGNIASVLLSINQLSLIITNTAIIRVEAFPPAVKPLNDSMLVNANILSIHNGTGPLRPQGYDGTGVIVGFIDTGIDITHPDFKDASGNTRILYLWDQVKTTGGAQPLVPGCNYGQEWNNTDIDNGSAVSHTDPTGHGTHVAGVGVGDGSATATPNFKGVGVAPKAKIIAVALDFTNSAGRYTIADAANYIYTKAAALGLPCVINASVGGDYGMHDGMDVESQLIKNLINAKTCQAFVAAAGNSGAKGAFHLAYTTSSVDTYYTLFAPSGGKVYVDIIADSSDLANVDFAIGADQMVPVHSVRGNTPFTTISSMPLQTVVTVFVKNASNQQIGKVQYYLDKVNGVYDLQYFITPDSAAYNWRVMTKGTGKFDLWNYNAAGNSYVPIVNSVTTISTFPDAAFYKYPDTEKSIQGGFQCLDEVITVGNYQNRKGYKDCNGGNYSNPSAVVGQLISTSSHGPTRDGRIKPDITAPGDLTIAAAAVQVRGFTANMAEGCFHIRDGGTSHSSPVVAGLVALYLQKNTCKTALQVRDAIIGSASQDAFTGHDLPNNSWGYGKLDGFGALIETVAITSQPQDKSICENSTTTFGVTASGTGLTYLWQMSQGAGFVDLTNTSPYTGVTASTLTITATPVTLDGYKYRCLVTNAYASDITSDSATLTVKTIPTVASSPSTPDLCFSNAAQTTALSYSGFTGAPIGYNFTWNAAATAAGFVGVNNVGSATITVTAPAAVDPGTYTATLTINDANGCVSNPGNIFTTTVLPIPSITTAAATTTVCYSNSQQTAPLTYSALSGSPTKYSISWDAMGTAAGLLPVNPTAIPSSPILLTIPGNTPKGVYTGTILVKNINNCLGDPTNFTLTVDSIPYVTATAGNVTTICPNASATLSLVTSNGTTINWTENGAGSITSGATSLTPTYAAAAADEGNKVVLTMTASSTSFCGTSTVTATDTVFVSATPVVTISGLASKYCYNATPQILTGSPAGGLFSGTGITSAAGIFDPSLVGNGSSSTITYVYVDGNNCMGSSSRSTTVLTQALSPDSCTTKLDGSDGNSANIFTPNGDGINDEFNVSYPGSAASDFNLSIFDRWGTPVFISTNPSVKWDGRTTAGMKVTGGTYFYVLINAGVNYKGYISLYQ